MLTAIHFNSNHETWYECPCGAVYDRHLHGDICPQCGRSIPNTRLPHKQTAIAFLIVGLLLSFPFMGTNANKYKGKHKHSISTTIGKLQKKVRHHRTHTRMQCIQSKRNYTSRDANGWPFRFLE